MRIALTFLLLVFTVSLAGAEVYEPKPGTPERKAIMDALRVPISRHAGKPVEFTGEIKVSGDWAKFDGDAATKDGKPPVSDDAKFDFELDLFALLKKEKGEWKVLYWGFAGDIGAMEEAKKKFPKVPKDLIPDIQE